MRHLWDVARSQANGCSTSWCDVRIDKLPSGDTISERHPVECEDCLLLSAPVGFDRKQWMETAAVRGDGDSEKDGRIKFLTNYRPTLMKYLEAKFQAEDWHGVQDAASDLRDLDSELDGLRY